MPVALTTKPEPAHLRWAVVLLAFGAQALLAQSCPKGPVDKPIQIDQARHANSPDAIFRLAAISGNALAPALRKLSQPRLSADTVPGAAQVSLARLGDKNALTQLEQEINGIHSPYDAGVGAIDKLTRVGTDKAISILMTFLQAHLTDSSFYIDMGDTAEDLRQSIVNVIASRLQVGPLAPNGNFSVSLQDWMTWWNQVKGQPIVLSISPDLQDPYLRCLARKVEWGFPDAIFDLANSKDPQVLPVLRKLAAFGEHNGRSFNLTTIRGRAEFGLAQMGDQEELEAIKRELNGLGYPGAIQELSLLGGKDAVAALIAVFDSPDFLPRYKGFKLTYQKQVNRRDQELQRALIQMVKSPPETEITPDGKRVWKDWWAKNQSTAQFVIPPVKTYE